MLVLPGQMWKWLETPGLLPNLSGTPIWLSRWHQMDWPKQSNPLRLNISFNNSWSPLLSFDVFLFFLILVILYFMIILHGSATIMFQWKTWKRIHLPIQSIGDEDRWVPDSTSDQRPTYAELRQRDRWSRPAVLAGTARYFTMAISPWENDGWTVRPPFKYRKYRKINGL